MSELRGIGASDGLVVGPALVWHKASLQVDLHRKRTRSPQEELERLEAALEMTSQELQSLRGHLGRALGPDHAAILDAQLLILEDEDFLSAVRGGIEKEGFSAEAAFARAMAEGARARFGADIAVATTGISGPGGGSEEKPVGLVFLALADAEGSEAHSFVIPLDRKRHRELTAQLALDWVRRKLLGFEYTAPRFLTQQEKK